MLSAFYRRSPLIAGVLCAGAFTWEGITRRAVPWWAVMLICAGGWALAFGFRGAIIERDQALTLVSAAAAGPPGASRPREDPQP